MSNCRIGARNYGERRFSVASLNHGMSFVTGGTSTTRNQRWFYNKKVSSSSFSLVATCNSYDDYLESSNWLSRYMAIKSNPDTGDSYGPLRVQIANVNWDESQPVSFDKTGILTSAVPYGDTATSVTYQIQMSFTGASNAIDLSSGTAAEGLFSQPLPEQDPSFKYFYPFSNPSPVTGSRESQTYGENGISFYDVIALLR